MMNNEVDPAKINGPDVILAAMEEEKMTAKYLVKRLKRELNAKKPTRLKVKGVLTPELTPKGKNKKGAPKVVGISGLVLEDDDGEKYGEGETVLEFLDDDIGTQQKARMDAHKLRGDYPVVTHELIGSVTVTPKLSDEDREIAKNITRQAIDAIIDKHRRSDT